MVTENGNEKENRDGNSSSENKSNGGVKKKRTRVGDLRKQSFDTDRSANERNPYRSSGDRQENSSYGPSRSYDRGDGERREERRPSYGNSGNRVAGGRGDYSGGRSGNSYGNRGGNSYSSNNNRGGSGYDNRRSSEGGYNRSGGYQRSGASGVKRLVKPVKYKENIDPSTPLRLNKYLANAGVCSRREADTYITSGVVKVNGVVVNELGAKVTRGDLVTFNDQPVRLESKVYVLLNKPKNCVTTSDDPQNRLTVMDLVKNACPERIYPVGRLDRNTTGVLLLTNDGDLASKLMHPKFKKKKIYQVTLDRDVAIEDMQAIADGIELDDGEIHADSIAYQSEDELNVIGIEIHSGRNRIVRRIFEKLGYQVMKLDRVYFAGLTKKNVLRGKWRYLTEKEVNMLRMGAFE